MRACGTLCAGLLLASIADPDPVIFFEAKMLYRTVVEDVPTGSYTIPLGQARIARTGGDITLIGWGQQVAVLERAVSERTPYMFAVLVCGWRGILLAAWVSRCKRSQRSTFQGSSLAYTAKSPYLHIDKSLLQR